MATSQSHTTSDVSLPPAEPLAVRSRYREAYERVLPEQAALDAAELLVINIDVTSACATVLGALPRIMTFRERATRLIEYEIKYFDNLETYALAVMHAQGEYVSASAPAEPLPALNEEGTRLRDILHSDALALANRGLVSGEPLKNLRGAAGYKNLAEDLVGLSSLLRRSWEKIGTRTTITMAELDQAEYLSERLLHAVAMRENASRALADAIQQRLRVFTMLVNAYDQVRRAISFLRWQDEDLEDIAPSLYAGRRRSKSEPPQSPRAAPHGAASIAAETATDRSARAEEDAGVPRNSPAS